MELWRDIPGYEGIYEASTLGNIRSCDGKTTSNSRYGIRHWKQRVLKQKIYANKKGRFDAKVILWKDGSGKTFLVSRLIAITWVDGYREGLTVNHIDGNPLNNTKSNLEWLSLEENIRKGFETGLFAAVQHPIKLRLVDEVFSFASKAEASRFLGRDKRYVSGCIKNNRPIKDVFGNVFEVVAQEIEQWEKSTASRKALDLSASLPGSSGIMAMTMPDVQPSIVETPGMLPM
jgi:hypothetical protein